MFEQSFVVGTSKTRKGWAMFGTFIGEVIVVGILILIPLIYTDVLPRATLTSFLTAPPPPPPPVAPKVVKVQPKVFNNTFTAPKEIPKQVAIIEEDTTPQVQTAVVGGVPGGVPGGVLGGGIGSIIGAVPAAAPPPPPPPPPKKEAPKAIRVGGQVQAANLIRKVAPPYPVMAKTARIQGAVVFNAIISKDGSVQSLMLVSGHPLLVPAATEAVKQWLYKPTLLNGDPVDVITQITVNFTLSQ